MAICVTLGLPVIYIYIYFCFKWISLFGEILQPHNGFFTLGLTLAVVDVNEPRESKKVIGHSIFFVKIFDSHSKYTHLVAWLAENGVLHCDDPAMPKFAFRSHAFIYISGLFWGKFAILCMRLHFPTFSGDDNVAFVYFHRTRTHLEWYTLLSNDANQ